MSEQRDPISRVVDAAVAMPLAMADATKQTLAALASTSSVLARRVAAGAGTLAVEAIAATARPAENSEPSQRPAPSSERQPRPTQASSQPAAAQTDVGELSIDGYDHLAARQVIERLDALTRDELTAIAAYESRGRNRQTILGRIRQLTVDESTAQPIG